MTGSKISTAADLNVRRGGSGSPTLILLHGLGANGEVWNRMLPIVRVGCTNPRRSYLRSVCGCMPSIRAATLMKMRS